MKPTERRIGCVGHDCDECTSSTAEQILACLDKGGREIVQDAVKKAIEQTKARNKARELAPDFLDRRITF